MLERGTRISRYVLFPPITSSKRIFSLLGNVKRENRMCWTSDCMIATVKFRFAMHEVASGEEVANKRRTVTEHIAAR